MHTVTCSAPEAYIMGLESDRIKGQMEAFFLMILSLRSYLLSHSRKVANAAFCELNLLVLGRLFSVFINPMP